MQIFGPSFGAELTAAGLGGLPLTWGSDGLVYGPSVTDEQRTAVEAVYAAHDPSRPVLPPLTARQLRLWLLGQGHTRADVEAAIASLPDEQRGVAEIEWEYSTQYLRDHPLIDQIGAAFGLTPGQIDAAWPEAAAL